MEAIEQKNQIDLSTLTADQLQEELKRRKTAEETAVKKARQEFIIEKDLFVGNTSETFVRIQKEMSDLKEATIRKANQLYNQMFEMKAAEPKQVNSFSFKNEADTIKVTVDRQERFEFNEEATVHINAIKDIFKAKFADRNKGLYNILDNLLVKGAKKEYDPKLLAKARISVRALGDNKLMEQFDKLQDCQRVVGSSMYCRLYMRDDKKKWNDVTLQFSAL